MAVVGIRSRDQVWQLMFVAIATSVVLLVAGILVLRGGDGGTIASEGGLTITDETLTGQVLSEPSGDDEDGSERSAGVIGPDGSSDADGDKTSTSSLEIVTTTTQLPPTTVEGDTTLPPDTEPSTTETTAPPTTGSTTSDQPVTTVPVETTTEPTVPPTTDPIVTIGPPITKPGDSVTPKQLAAARERWRSSGFDSYSMVVTRSCFCASDWLGPFEVTVRNGEVQSVRRVGEDNDADGRIDAKQLTVPGLFALIESALDADAIRVDFDKAHGYPRTINIDYILRAVDDEMSISVTDFRPMRGR